jgi:signal transduction histidine kinase
MRSQVAFDVVVAVLAAGLAVLVGRFDVGGMGLAVGFGIALAFRRVSPGIALAVAWLTAIMQMSTGQGVDVADLLVPPVLYATSASGGNRLRWLGLASATVGSIVAATYLVIHEYGGYPWGVDVGSVGQAKHQLDLVLHFTAYLVVVLALLLLPWLGGVVARARSAARMSREAQLLAERDAARADRAVAVEQERVRIAREMHDIVAHSLAVVIAQADGARYALRSSPETADAALSTISTTARRALGDVRDMLGALRHEQGTKPTPDVNDLEQLVSGMRDVGLDVRVSRSGDAKALPTTTQLAVYRIVQECLTNALKHGLPGTPVRVLLDYGSDTVAIDVVNAIRFDGIRGPGTGHGLVGMRERATMSGGTMTAGVRGASFEVSVRIPTHPNTGSHRPIAVPVPAPTASPIPDPSPRSLSPVTLTSADGPVAHRAADLGRPHATDNDRQTSAR